VFFVFYLKVNLQVVDEIRPKAKRTKKTPTPDQKTEKKRAT